MTTFAAGDLEPGVLSLKQAGQRLGIAESTAYDLHKRGQFPVPVIKIGGRNRVLTAVLERFLNGETLAPAAPDSPRGPAAADGESGTGAAGTPSTGAGRTGGEARSHSPAATTKRRAGADTPTPQDNAG